MGPDAPSPAVQARTGAAVCAGLFATLLATVATAGDVVTDADRVLGRAPYRFAQARGTVEAFAVGLEELTVPDHVVAVMIAVGAYLLVLGRPRLALLAAAVPWLADAAYPVLKDLLERPRPAPVDALHTIGGWSFPSGHATVFSAAGWVLMVVTVCSVADPVRRRRALVALAAAVALVAFDRLLLGVHYVSDVTAGLLLGAVLALGGAALLDPYGDRTAERTRRPEVPGKL